MTRNSEKRVRTIRRAQAVHPYGPGAILDWGQECFVVMDTRSGSWSEGPRVRLERLERLLRAPDGFRMPPIQRVEGSGRSAALSVQRFPAWLFCPKCRRMWKWGREEEVEEKGRLPRCKSEVCKGRTILVPMRYVVVCRNGHLSDVDWIEWAHSRRTGEKGVCERSKSSLVFEAVGGQGASLEALRVRCTRCEASRDLRDILSKGAIGAAARSCSGRQPWVAREKRVEGCTAERIVMQRSQTAVHFSDVVSALDLRTEPSPDLGRFDKLMRAEVSAQRISDLEDGKYMLDRLLRYVESELGEAVPRDRGERWLESYFSGTAGRSAPGSARPESEQDLLNEEWGSLTTPTLGDRSRAPLVVARDTDSEPDVPSAKLAPLFEGVFLIERLREVRALRGFRRVDPEGTLVPPDLGTEPRQRWLPATEVFGEGIFLQFSERRMEAWRASQPAALASRLEGVKAELAGGQEGARAGRRPGGPSLGARFGHLAELLPQFVMVHTFAHLLMRQLCYESGYAGAALRERLYVFEDRAGALIFTADGDSEGSLGGLVRQGRSDRLWRIVLSALERGAWCSNDPICSEMPAHGLGKLNLAACHACALAPETSCTHLNCLLDRQLVVGDGSTGVRGFFADALDETVREL